MNTEPTFEHTNKEDSPIENPSASIEKSESKNPFEKLYNKLHEAQHPYGLLIMATPLISAATPAKEMPFTSLGLSSASAATEALSGNEAGTAAKFGRDLSSAGAVALFSSADNPASALSSAGTLLSLKAEDGDSLHLPAGILLSTLGLSTNNSPEVADTISQALNLGGTQLEAKVVPLLASIKQKESLSSSSEYMEITDKQIRVGSILANQYVYNGKKEYSVSGEGLEKPYKLQPGEKILILHVNQSAEDYSTIDSLARIRKMRNDFQKFCELLDEPYNFELSEDQKKQIEELKQAPMIGVSHLAKLVARKNLPTWDIDILPGALRKFHSLDSQIVSRMFGGSRKVDIKDIKVMFLPPSMRKQAIKI